MLDPNRGPKEKGTKASKPKALPPLDSDDEEDSRLLAVIVRAEEQTDAAGSDSDDDDVPLVQKLGYSVSLRSEYKAGDLYSFKLTDNSYKGLEQIARELGWYEKGLEQIARIAWAWILMISRN